MTLVPALTGSPSGSQWPSATPWPGPSRLPLRCSSLGGELRRDGVPGQKAPVGSGCIQAREGQPCSPCQAVGPCLKTVVTVHSLPLTLGSHRHLLLAHPSGQTVPLKDPDHEPKQRWQTAKDRTPGGCCTTLWLREATVKLTSSDSD